MGHLSSSKYDPAVTLAWTVSKAEKFSGFWASLKIAPENVKSQSWYIFLRIFEQGLSREQWDSLGTGGPLHAALPESCPKHWQLEGSLVPLCSLCAWWAALQSTGGLEEQTGLAWLPGPKASSWGRPDLNNPLAPKRLSQHSHCWKQEWKWTEGFLKLLPAGGAHHWETDGRRARFSSNRRLLLWFNLWFWFNKMCCFLFI